MGMNNEAVRALEHTEMISLMQEAGIKECVDKSGPAGGMDQLQRVGSAYLCIFHDDTKIGRRNNRGMMYVVGPNGVGQHGPRNKTIKSHSTTKKLSWP